MREEVLLFGEKRSLVGVLTDPPETKRDLNPPAVILLNAGIVHRVGPNRLHVKMARSLAEMGLVVLRFDFSGIGDSKVRQDNLPFARSAISETQAAMNCLEQVRDAHRFVLIGLCSGATVSRQTACLDSRVVGAVLLNAEPDENDNLKESSADIADRRNARYYWKRALFNPQSWWKAVTGKAHYRKMARALGFQLRSGLGRQEKLSAGTNQVTSDFRLLIERGVHLLFVFEPGDPGLDYLDVTAGDELRQWHSCGRIGWQIVRGSNHTFTSLDSQERLLKLICDWHRTNVQH
jgi:alpha/beta superfamily hydrolase